MNGEGGGGGGGKGLGEVGHPYSQPVAELRRAQIYVAESKSY